jgi:type IV secretion system protein VirB5
MIGFKKTKLAAALFTLALFSAQPTQAQIPVTDAISIAQDAYEHVETLGKWVQQYQQLRAQIELYTYQLESLTGKRGLGGIFNALQAEGLVPDDVKQIVLVATDTKAKLEQIDQSLKNGITHTTARQGQLQQLLRQIDNTEDPKAIAELQARMSGEQVAVQNEGNRMAAFAEQMRNQERLVANVVTTWRNNKQLMTLQ